MNNAKAEVIRAQTHERSAEPYSDAPPVTARPDEVMRDFFRRGDRGQYEGGAGDRVLDSIPTWDLPDRPQIVRTPRQQARRAALIRVEAIFMVACVVLLVTAALSKLSGGSQPQRVTPAEAKRQPTQVAVTKPAPAANILPAQEGPAVAAHAMPPPPAPALDALEPEETAASAPIAAAPVAAAPIVAAPVAPVPVSMPSKPASKPPLTPATPTRAAVAAKPASVAVAPTTAARPRQTAQQAYPPAAVTPAPVARRAVAAFPD